jgi:hypothetical protein
MIAVFFGFHFPRLPWLPPRANAGYRLHTTR